MKKHIVIVGLGLIGGSMARALRGFEGYDLVGVDVSQPTLRYAVENGIVDAAEEDPVRALAEGDLVFLCLHPRGIVDFMAQHRDHFKPGAMVTDVCGVKGAVLEGARVLPDTVSFLGGHPMAGTEFSGIQHSLANMFRGAHYILTPNSQSSPEHIALMERVARHIGCADVVKTTPERHDAIIAYTSQMMHVIAVSVCDDENLFQYQGFEGDSAVLHERPRPVRRPGAPGGPSAPVPPGHSGGRLRPAVGKAGLLRRPQAEVEPPGAGERGGGPGGLTAPPGGGQQKTPAQGRGFLLCVL